MDNKRRILQVAFLLVTACIFLLVDAATIPKDSEGSCRIEGYVWQVDDCKSCQCTQGKIHCDVITCTLFDDVGCNNYVKVPGTCCNYVCLDGYADMDDTDLGI